MQEKINIGFIGAGNMGSAIMKGIAERGLKEDYICLYAFDKLSQKTDELKKYGVEICASENEIVSKCKYVFLAVKPQVIENVLDTISSDITPENVIISIAAGISDEYIVSKTIPDAKVILVMPNTPLLLGEGASALSRNEKVNDDEFKLICNIFAMCGKTAVIPKNKMKEVIAVNSSSPAFIYLFAKSFIEYGEKSGIDPEAVKNLFAQALIGSAKMITDSGYTIDELIKMVSSPGGTTLAGLDALYEGRLSDTVKDACERCTKRAYELSK